MEKLLDWKQAAGFLGLSPITLRTYVAWGIIPFIKPDGRVIRFRLEDLQAYLDRPGVRALRQGATGNGSK